MCSMEARVRVSGRVGRDERQVPLEGEIDQSVLRRLFDRVVPADDFNVQSFGEQGLKAVEIEGDRSE